MKALQVGKHIFGLILQKWLTDLSRWANVTDYSFAVFFTAKTDENEVQGFWLHYNNNVIIYVKSLWYIQHMRWVNVTMLRWYYIQLLELNHHSTNLKNDLRTRAVIPFTPIFNLWKQKLRIYLMSMKNLIQIWELPCHAPIWFALEA